MKVSIDFDYIPQRQNDIHEQLVNWQRWVMVRPHGWHIAPMWRNAQSNSRQWHPPEVKTPVDTQAAMKMEKAISALPHKHRTALRWFYVFRGSPTKTAKSLSASLDTLFDLVISSRDELRKHLQGMKNECILRVN